MSRKKKPTANPEPEELDEELDVESLDLEPEDEGEAEAAEADTGALAPAPVVGAHAHNHFCEVCLQPVAHCGAEGPCQHPGPQYCSVHHPDPEFKVEDKPVIRMHVKLAE